MATAIRMPDLGTTVETVTLVAWLKNEGDAVARGEPLCQVETDKATSDLESVAAGVLLRQVVPPDTEIEVGQIIAYIGKPGEAIPETDAPREAASAGSPEKSAPDRAAGQQRITPLIRNLADRLGVDVDAIVGTGPGGRVTREDVQRAKDNAG